MEALSGLPLWPLRFLLFAFGLRCRGRRRPGMERIAEKRRAILLSLNRRIGRRRFLLGGGSSGRRSYSKHECKQKSAFAHGSLQNVPHRGRPESLHLAQNTVFANTARAVRQQPDCRKKDLI